MAKVNPLGHTDTTGQVVQGRSVASLGRGMALVKIGRTPKQAMRPEDKTTVLVMKAARALNEPGIDRSVVFQGPNAAKIFSYSVYPQDTTKVIRESSDGARVLGRLVDGKFKAVKASV
ncbi:MAG: hypothetical protein CFE39_10665 [Comamonadaceae bacterium PBBC2]|nr:MAG: hypothetical protein CFE39_10665 [Comamonadaceae bacterium PBBC2]